jgi:hypothetical protein
MDLVMALVHLPRNAAIYATSNVFASVDCLCNAVFQGPHTATTSSHWAAFIGQ